MLGGKGLIERQTDPMDRRFNITLLTQNGKDLVEQLMPIIEPGESALLEVLSEAEQKELERLLSALLKERKTA